MTMALADCGTNSNYDPTQKQVNLVLTKCPVLKNYSNEELLAAAEQLSNIPSESQIAKMVNDYGKLREACRIITKKLKQ